MKPSIFAHKKTIEDWFNKRVTLNTCAETSIIDLYNDYKINSNLIVPLKKKTFANYLKVFLSDKRDNSMVLFSYSKPSSIIGVSIKHHIQKKRTEIKKEN